MLRKIRILLAAIVIVSVTMLFIGIGGWHKWAGWLAHVQFLPAVLALNVVVVVVLLLLTLLFGRWYCSVLCPLGVMQDVVSSVYELNKKRRFRFGFSGAKNWLRYGVLAVFVVSLLAGLNIVYEVLSPYSSFGRIVSQFTRFDSMPVLITAIITFVILLLLVWRGGRTYCNTICPVGTVLGLFSRFSLYRVRINSEKCVGCGVCAKRCKSSCIDAVHHHIDASRCVDCMNCISACGHRAISYSLKKSKPTNGPSDPSRRRFFAATAAVTATALVSMREKHIDRPKSKIVGKNTYESRTRPLPPGAISFDHLSQHCTACQLCISQCPNHVLRPSASLSSLMQPEMHFDKGYCHPRCTRCSSVCPTNAISKISKSEKPSIKIGKAVWVPGNCFQFDDKLCGACAGACPYGAIEMMPYDVDDAESPTVPKVDATKCVGCGACEYACPAFPKAICVEGYSLHIKS